MFLLILYLVSLEWTSNPQTPQLKTNYFICYSMILLLWIVSWISQLTTCTTPLILSGFSRINLQIIIWMRNIINNALILFQSSMLTNAPSYAINMIPMTQRMHGGFASPPFYWMILSTGFISFLDMLAQSEFMILFNACSIIWPYATPWMPICVRFVNTINYMVPAMANYLPMMLP